ncbi:MAG: signal peptidase I [Endomicrobium sp.]|jgi:signal peptidase I|nr:signal peptidase I [Endomicrobium sp.]
MELKLFITGCILFIMAVIMLVIRKCFKISSSQRFFKNIYSLIDSLWTSLILASFIMFFFVQAFKIPSGSMRNTFLEGDHLFVNKFIYGFSVPFTSCGKRYLPFKNISRGDIVVFQCPPKALTIYEREIKVRKNFIKRCVAFAGDIVEVRNKKLFVNGISVVDKYAIFNDANVIKTNLSTRNRQEYQKDWEEGKFVLNYDVRDNFGPVNIPEGHYMMMGDNRDYSFDSRFWGPLPDKYVKGKALLIYWPLYRWRII